ncbi:hypothetical protein KTO58_09900 [Chitinophaga pendula]|uniref:DUF5952 family protein n=1 Tax=Chitinophaga TaxID=79328 RepID=UPI000BAECCBD|nr:MULTISPECIES: DUF5952 family protein [Chitinophaga]ASZ12896.1 hypothetical protein CK934_19005 [Chitinophaga sp. MD30]UCJ09476.1 hypothetical protein KTO58_09900 [Chitinophaga pendula]
MRKYVLKIDCDVLNEMGLTVNRLLSVATSTEPLPGDNYRFLIGDISHPIIIKIVEVVSILPTSSDEVMEIQCNGEEIDEDDTGIKENFAWHTFSFY